MLQLLDSPRPDVLAMRIDGKVPNEDFDRIARHVEDLLERVDKLNVYAEIVKFGGMSLATFAKDFWFSIKHRDQFSRLAVVTDTSWLAAMVRAEGMLFPQIEVKTFPLADSDEAMAWVAGS